MREAVILRRVWDAAQTPFERLKATGVLSPEQQQRLQTRYDQTNPRALRQQIYQALAALYESATQTRHPCRKVRHPPSGNIFN